jgi:hypothetical protein
MRLETATLANAQSTAANFNSAVAAILHMGFAALQIITTGTPSGVVKLQGSNDGVNFGDLGIASTTITTAGVQPMLLLPNIGYAYIQAVWTGSGTGTITLVLNAKGF